MVYSYAKKKVVDKKSPLVCFLHFLNLIPKSICVRIEREKFECCVQVFEFHIISDHTMCFSRRKFFVLGRKKEYFMKIDEEEKRKVDFCPQSNRSIIKQKGRKKGAKRVHARDVPCVTNIIN